MILVEPGLFSFSLVYGEEQMWSSVGITRPEGVGQWGWLGTRIGWIEESCIC